MNKLYAFADLPRTGLCNMLNVWARAFLWAKDHNAEMIAPKWTHLGRLGPWLRRERDKRYYINQITNDGYVSGIKRWWLLHFATKTPEADAAKVKNGIVVFSGQARDLLDVCDRRYDLKKELMRIASYSVLSQLDNLPSEYMAVHIRKGDFKKNGKTLPDEYYIKAIRKISAEYPDSPILIFSDASQTELEFLKQVGADIFMRIQFVAPAPALRDVLALSNAKCLVCTNGSSFSEWAACLRSAEGVVIVSKDAVEVVEKKVSGRMIKL